MGENRGRGGGKEIHPLGKKLISSSSLFFFFFFFFFSVLPRG